MNKPAIMSKRLYFGQWTDKSLPDAKILWGDPLVSKFICASGIFTEEDIEARLNTEISNRLLHGIQYWPIYEKTSDNIVGCCGFRPYGNDALEFGIHIRSAFWRQGFAFEAASAAISYCITHLNPKKIVAGHNPNNTASAALLKKLGFVFTHFEHYEPTGLMHPTYVFRP